MDAALGPYDEYVEIRDPEVFAAWKSTPGLRCLVCRYPVNVYRSVLKRRFVRHGKGNASQRNPYATKSAHETFVHERLKHWVRAELKQHGSNDVRVEARVDTRQPDVLGHIGARSYAVEVQWSSLAKAEAEARTLDIRASGVDEVLWPTRTCAWVEQLPTLGIESFDPLGDDYLAHTGFLAYRPNDGMHPVQTSVREALRTWVSGALAWAYRDHKKAGWAAVTDWKLHTRAQADEIVQKKRLLAKTLDEKIAAQNTQLHQVNEALDDERRRRSGAEQELLQPRGSGPQAGVRNPGTYVRGYPAPRPLRRTGHSVVACIDSLMPRSQYRPLRVPQ